jgi:DNA-binding beta-propeller fold protein YncE
MKRRIVIGFAVFVVVTCCSVLPHQVVMAGMESPYISWVSKYPASTGDQDRRNFGTRIADFILGRKSSTDLVRPVAITMKDSLTSFILDQETGALFRLTEKRADLPRLKNKIYKKFPSLVGISSFENDNLLFTDSYYNKIFLCNPGKKELRLLTDSTFDRPTGIAYWPKGKQIWVVETNAHRVTILDEHGKVIRRIGKRGTAEGEFNYPTSVWIDTSGKAYIVDAMNFRVQIFSSEGEFLSMFGKPGDGSGDFARPKGIATDSYGNIYIVDALFSAVQIFNQKGELLYSFGSRGHGNGEFWLPTGIFIDARDRIYVTDSYNSRIQVFQLMNGGAK